jgi:radical SAM protein (TIGR01212 family)
VYPDSTNPSTSTPGSSPDWLDAGLRYYSLSHFLQQKFGGRVWKVTLDGKFGCPNADGTLSHGGCVFCNIASFSPSRRLKIRSITQQLAEGIQRVSARHSAERFLAYFQPATNTYAPVERLCTLFEEALQHPQVVGLAIGTRPDCVPDPVLDLLAELSRRTWVSLELGLQTIHDRTLNWMNRQHHYDAFLDAVDRGRQRGLHLGAHVILGLPGETAEDMRATARELGRLRIDAVKIHNLCVSRNTRLAELWSAGKVPMLDAETYAECVADFLELLAPTTVVDRVSADAPAEYLLACVDTSAIRRRIEGELQRRGTRQGVRWGG